MIVAWFWDMQDALILSLFASFPTIETPVWLAQNLPEVIKKIVAFNYYLPVLEAVGVVISLLSVTLIWKLIKVVLGVLQIDLNA